MYLHGGANSTARALALRERYILEFGNTTCDGLFDQDSLCIYDVENIVDGIFLSGNWAAYIPLENYTTVVSWTAQHRGDLDILFHPNSDQYVHDHFRWSTWLGRPWPLNVEAFSQYNEVTGEYCNMWSCMFGTPGGWGAIE